MNIPRSMPLFLRIGDRFRSFTPYAFTRLILVFDRRAKYFFLLRSRSRTVASAVRHDSIRGERENAPTEKEKQGEGGKKKKKKRKRLYAALPFDLPTTVAILHGVTVYHAQNVTNDRANVERGSASDSCVKRSRTAYRRALLDLCC